MAKVIFVFLSVAIIVLFPSMAACETIDVLIRGVDDGFKTNKERDYKEAVIDAWQKAIERAGVEINSIDKAANLDARFDMVESKAKAVLLPGFQIMDMGHQTDGTYQIVLSGKVETGKKEAARQSADRKGFRYAKSLWESGNKVEATRIIRKLLNSSQDDVKADAIAYTILWDLNSNYKQDRKILIKFKEDYPDYQNLWDVESVVQQREDQDAEHRRIELARISSQFVYIRPGTFVMGSPSSEYGRVFNEKLHQVTLTNGFYLQTTEVTQGQWYAVMGTRPWAGKKFVQTGDEYPAVYISWVDVQSFISKLNQLEDVDKYCLPTEAQWEYACRAGSKTVYSYGDDANRLGQYAWYNCNERDVDAKYAYRVAQKKPNTWGLYDMHGNVYEWCQDWFGQYPADIITDPTGPSIGSHRVRRGGGWGDHARICRSAVRKHSGPKYRNRFIGFRLSRTK